MTKKEKSRPARLLGQALRCAAGALIAGAIGASIGAGPSFPVRDAGFGEWTAILTGASNAQALEPGRRYDDAGRYQGKVTEDGRIYDRTGRYQGKVTEDGRVYDRTGRYQGRIDD